MNDTEFIKKIDEEIEHDIIDMLKNGHTELEIVETLKQPPQVVYDVSWRYKQ